VRKWPKTPCPTAGPADFPPGADFRRRWSQSSGSAAVGLVPKLLRVCGPDWRGIIGDDLALRPRPNPPSPNPVRPASPPGRPMSPVQPVAPPARACTLPATQPPLGPKLKFETELTRLRFMGEYGLGEGPLAGFEVTTEVGIHQGFSQGSVVVFVGRQKHSASICAPVGSPTTPERFGSWCLIFSLRVSPTGAGRALRTKSVRRTTSTRDAR
jgi:hypothetical protein